jgi:hypothetical protein
MRMTLRIATILLLICLSISAPAFARGVNAKLGYVDAFRETMNRLVQADNVMYEQMRVIARRLEDYYLRTGHLPFAGTQQEKFKQKVEADSIPNPYKPQTTELYYGMDMKDDGRVKMWFLNDPFLTIEHSREWKRQAPQGWTADPGTIMVMLNGEGTYTIWAASADRLPLRDYARGTNLTRLIFHDLAEEFRKSP